MVLERLLTPLATRPARKAESGIGAVWMSNEPQLSILRRSPQRMMADAQSVSVSNRWIRAAERVISHAFGTVSWHLEDEEDEQVTDDSALALVAIRDLMEKPYTPQPGDPINATPKTRSGLWSITARHMGVCGSAFWYLDQTEVIGKTPAQILYVNPARMTPAGGARLAGWVLDADARGGGTPLKVEQVLHFTLEEPDQGFFPPGLVESAMSSVLITRHSDRHAAGAMASGGKLSGVYSPKGEAGVMPPDVFEQLERELRAASEDPDATRRSMILRGPIDFTATAATPEQLDLVAVQQMARDDVLGLWGVPLSQLGIAAPAGLNSGNTKSYDEAALWQKAVGPRLRRFWEVVQFQFLDRYAALGTPVELVIEEPTFDDDAPKFELANSALSQPLRNVERRALLGYDPIGDPVLDNMIVLPMTMVEFAATPEAPVKASLANRLEKALAAFLADQKRAIAARVRDRAAHLAKKPTDDDAWWNADEWDKRLKKVLQPFAKEYADQQARSVEKMLQPAAKAGEFGDLAGNRVLQRLLGRLGTRITGINETTRSAVADAIREGVEAGDGAAQLGDRVEAISGFDEYRAELIARTESAQVLNEAQLESFREFGVTKVRAIDGDDDEECAARNGQEFPLEEALGIQDHPNGTLDWVPVI